jgi:hypothetical protein
MIAGLAAIVILLVIAGVHVYRAAGGKAGKGAAVPSIEGKPVLKPSASNTALVAAGLCALAAIVALRDGLIVIPPLSHASTAVKIATWPVAAVFALRAIGDFRYVGFFKSIRNSRFARLDTLAYSPLCAVLALLIGVAAAT